MGPVKGKYIYVTVNFSVLVITICSGELDSYFY